MSRRKSSRKNKSAIKKNMEQSGAGETPVSRHLRAEDAALWAEVTKSLTPLKEDQDRLHFGPLLDEKPDLAQNWPSTGSGDAKQGKFGGANECSGVFSGRSRSGPGTNNVTPVMAIPSVPELSSFTRREMRQIDSGRQPIEARLDLHGLRQAAAHVALRGFLINAQSRDLRHVLVITGKGRSSRSDDLIPGYEDEYDLGSEQGVLRRVVPLWLSEPDLRDIVTGFNEAPRRHGGEGALYVRLRRNR